MIISLLQETAHCLRDGTIIEECDTVKENDSNEGGELFLNYLFKINNVNSITLNQAQKICSIESWKDKCIQNIFDKNEKQTEEEKKKEKITITFLKSTEKHNYCYRTKPYED